MVPSKKILLLLFLLIYIPFFLRYGRNYISIDHIDFPSFYSAAKIAFDNHQSPYEYESLHQAGVFKGPPYMYPPPSLLIFYPLSLMSYQTAKTVMLAISHLCLLFFIYIFFFNILKLKFHPIFYLFSIVYVFSFFPIVHTLWLGQVNLLVLVFLCFSWYAFQKNSRSVQVALPMSLAIILKAYPALFVLYFMTKKKYAIVLWILGFLAIYSIIAYFPLPQKAWSDWFTGVLPSGAYGKEAMNVLSPTSPWNQSVNGFISRIFIQNRFSESFFHSPSTAQILPYFISVIILLTSIGICCFSAKRQGDRMLIHQEFSLFLLTMYLIAPLSWDHHLVLVLPSIILIIYLLVYHEKKLTSVIIVGLSVLLLGWKLNLGSPSLTSGLLTLVISIKLYAVIVLWIYLVIRLGQSLRDKLRSANVV